MGKYLSLFIRIGLFLIGVFLLAFSIFTINNLVLILKDLFLNMSFDFSNLNSMNLIYSLVSFFLAYPLLIISVKWKSSFKHFSSTILSLSLISLSIFIGMFSIYLSSNDLANSIQPTMDYSIVNLLDEPINKYIDSNSGSSLKLILFDKSINKRFEVNKINLSDAQLISDALEFGNISDKEKLAFSNFFISSSYELIKNTKPEILNAGIPLNLLKSETEKYGFDLSLISVLDLTLLEFIPLNEGAYLNILITKGENSKVLTIGNISNDDIDLIWDNLNLNNNVSNNTKYSSVNLLLSSIVPYSNLFVNFGIPIASFSSIIPIEVINAINLDFLSEDKNKRMDSIIYLRNSCNNNLEKSAYFTQICNYIDYTNYSYLMTNAQNISSKFGYTISEKHLDLIDSLNTSNKIAYSLKNSNSNYGYFLILFLVLFSISILFYLGHLKINFERKDKEEIMFYISRKNLILFIPYIFISLIVYYLFSSKAIFSFFENSFTSQINNYILILTSTPLYFEFINILGLNLILTSIYFILSLALFLIYFRFLKKY